MTSSPAGAVPPPSAYPPPSYPPPYQPPSYPPAAEPRPPWFSWGEVVVAAALVAVLAAVGALAGLIWSAWDNGATRGLVYTKTAIIPDQTEGFISTDGRFVVITGVIGLVAGSVAWLLRAHRGPTVAAALVLGGLAGALLTDVVGRATGGGTDSGTVNTLIARLPLRVHAHGILVIEAILALAVYVTCAMVARPDDLGVPAARGAPAADDAEGADVATSSVGSRLDP